MTQKTFKVEHPGTHAPTDKQISAALTKALREDDLARDGEHRIVSYSETSGGPSQYTVELDTKPRGAGSPEDADADADANANAGGSLPGEVLLDKDAPAPKTAAKK